jgi:hypothetical protein
MTVTGIIVGAAGGDVVAGVHAASNKTRTTSNVVYLLLREFMFFSLFD